MLNLSRLAMFVAVVDAKSFTGAAAALGQTKAVVSFNIRQLESELGVTLLLRSTRRLTLTDAGERLYQRSLVLLKDADALLDDVASDYERELVNELGPEPVIDLMILGMGPDGHYASLFPGHDEVKVTDRLTVGVNHSPKMPPLRVSLTAPLIARSRHTWFFAAGAGKAESLAHVFEQPNNPDYPSSYANGVDEFIWFSTEETVTEL